VKLGGEIKVLEGKRSLTERKGFVDGQGGGRVGIKGNERESHKRERKRIRQEEWEEGNERESFEKRETGMRNVMFGKTQRRKRSTKNN
jgi:hypothetical protein